VEPFSSSVILIMAISKAFELEIVTGFGYHEFARPSQGDMALRNYSILSPEDSSSALHHWSFYCQCSLNGGTCMLWSFCAWPPLVYGQNCEHGLHKENCESVPHDIWLTKKCSMCKCWPGQFHCFPWTFLPGCDGLMIDEHFLVSRTPELTLSLASSEPGACFRFCVSLSL
uniref:Cryptic/Cripto CFC domain-containing protein n=1 Tax=Suricata suricatta TaxID=37032 RepID=A0A673UPR0_SURSU